jgi:uncharacterized integral membrane protein
VWAYVDYVVKIKRANLGWVVLVVRILFFPIVLHILGISKL